MPRTSGHNKSKEYANVVNIRFLVESSEQIVNPLILYVFVLGGLNGMVAINVETGISSGKDKILNIIV